jgi:hypothetical protein
MRRLYGQALLTIPDGLILSRPSNVAEGRLLRRKKSTASVGFLTVCAGRPRSFREARSTAARIGSATVQRRRPDPIETTRRRDCIVEGFSSRRKTPLERVASGDAIHRARIVIYGHAAGCQRLRSSSGAAIRRVQHWTLGQASTRWNSQENTCGNGRRSSIFKLDSRRPVSSLARPPRAFRVGRWERRCQGCHRRGESCHVEVV